MNISINILEVASELANIQVHETLKEETDIYTWDNLESSRYTETAQEIFNEWYDYYYDFLLTFND